MSGSTKVTQRGELYCLSLETPCISFRHDDDVPGEPTHEQRFHADARARFEAALAPLDPGLGQALAALRPVHGLVPWTEDLPLVPCLDDWALRMHADDGGGPCRVALHVPAPPSAGGFASIEVALAALPARDALERLERDVSRAITDLCR